MVCLTRQTGQPVAGARVCLPIGPWIDPFSSWTTWAAQSDGAGAATLLNVPEGGWLVAGSAFGYEMAAQETTLTSPQPLGAAGIGVLDSPLTITLYFDRVYTSVQNWELYE